jgi:WD40 repeat protein
MTNGYAVWDGLNGEKLFMLEREKEYWGVGSVAFSPDGEYLAVGFLGEIVVEVWWLEDRELILELVSPIHSAYSAPAGVLAAPPLRSGPGPYFVNSLAFSADGNMLAVANGLGDVEQWYLGTGKIVNTIEGKSGHLFFWGDDQWLVSWDDEFIRQINPDSGADIHFTWDFTTGHHLNFSPDGQWLFAGSAVWLVDTAERVEGFWGEEIMSVSPTGDFFYTYTREAYTVTTRRMSDFDVVSQVVLSSTEYVPWDGVYNFLETPFFSPTGEFVSGYIYDFGLYTWELSTNTIVEELTTFGWGGAYSPDGSMLVLPGGSDILLFQLKPEITLLDEVKSSGNVFAFSPDNSLLASVSYDSVTVFSISGSGKLEELFTWSFDTGLSGRVVAFSPGADLVAVTSWDRVEIIAVETEEKIAEYHPHFDGILDIAFSPDGRYLATTSWDGTVRLWGTAP